MVVILYGTESVEDTFPHGLTWKMLHMVVMRESDRSMVYVVYLIALSPWMGVGWGGGVCAAAGRNLRIDDITCVQELKDDGR